MNRKRIKEALSRQLERLEKCAEKAMPAENTTLVATANIMRELTIAMCEVSATLNGILDEPEV